MIDNSPGLLRQSIRFDATLDQVDRLRRAHSALQHRITLDQLLEFPQRYFRVWRPEDGSTQFLVHVLGMDGRAEHCLVYGCIAVDRELDWVSFHFHQKRSEHANALSKSERLPHTSKNE